MEVTKLPIAIPVIIEPLTDKQSLEVNAQLPHEFFGLTALIQVSVLNGCAEAIKKSLAMDNVPTKSSVSELLQRYQPFPLKIGLACILVKPSGAGKQGQLQLSVTLQVPAEVVDLAAIELNFIKLAMVNALNNMMLMIVKREAIIDGSD